MAKHPSRRLSVVLQELKSLAAANKEKGDVVAAAGAGPSGLGRTGSTGWSRARSSSQVLDALVATAPLSGLSGLDSGMALEPGVRRGSVGRASLTDLARAGGGPGSGPGRGLGLSQGLPKAGSEQSLVELFCALAQTTSHLRANSNGQASAPRGSLAGEGPSGATGGAGGTHRPGVSPGPSPRPGPGTNSAGLGPDASPDGAAPSSADRMTEDLRLLQQLLAARKEAAGMPASMYGEVRARMGVILGARDQPWAANLALQSCPVLHSTET